MDLASIAGVTGQGRPRVCEAGGTLGEHVLGIAVGFGYGYEYAFGRAFGAVHGVSPPPTRDATVAPSCHNRRSGFA